MAEWSSKLFLEFNGDAESEELRDLILETAEGNEIEDYIEDGLEEDGFWLEELNVDGSEIKDYVEKLSEALTDNYSDCEFKIEGSSEEMSSCGKGYYLKKYADGKMYTKIVECFDGFEGQCPECGNDLIDFKNYEPGKMYLCTDCGAQVIPEDSYSINYKNEITPV